MANKSYRVAIPADIYISVVLPADAKMQDIFKAAVARIDEVGNGDGLEGLKRAFEENEHVLVYPKCDGHGNLLVNQCTLEDSEDVEDESSED